MKTVLIYTGDDGEMFVWETTSHELREQAFLDLFGILKERGQFSSLDVVENQLQDMALRGSAKYAQALILVRDIPYAEVPLKEQKRSRPQVVRKIDSSEALLDQNVPGNTG